LDRYDFVVIGAGAAGEAAAYAALERGRTVAVVERELFGGSCPYWACVPSKSLLHAASERKNGYDWFRASDRRDYMINREYRNWPDDGGHVRGLESAGARTFRGQARIAGPGQVEVTTAGGTTARIEARTIVVATGSRPQIPELEGLAETEPWTNREATTTRKPPYSLAVLGGGATGVELASVFARFGVHVSLIHSRDRVLDKDHGRNSDAAGSILRTEGVDLRLGTRAVRVRPKAGTYGWHVVELDNGGSVEAERILVALGRAFDLDQIGLENVGVDVGSLRHDGALRIADDVYLIGDPAGPELFTHVSHYQGALAVRMALGESVEPDYRAVPRAVFLDPEIASVGMDVDRARAAGIDAAEFVADFTTTTRGYELEATLGHLAIVVDQATHQLVGASVVAPDASAAIHEPALAIQARLPIATLASMIHAFPSTSRAFDGLYAQAVARLAPDPVTA